MEIRKNTIGEMHPDYASLLNNIVITYLAIGDYNKALEYK